jgi:hypothetical protein
MPKRAKQEPRTSDVLQVGHVVSDGGKVGRVKGVPGRVPRSISNEDKKTILTAARLGMPVDRLAGIVGLAGNMGGWHRLLDRDPEFKEALERERYTGEAMLLSRISCSEQGWQGAAWLLERARGYVARASMEHTGKGGSTLTIAHQLLSSVAERER